MPLHDWTKADDGLFHVFHTAWMVRLMDALNAGILPAGYFALIEQHSGVYVPDVLALTTAPRSPAPGGNGVAVAEPRAERQEVLKARRAVRPHRRVVVRTARRVVAVVEIVSRANKD